MEHTIWQNIDLDLKDWKEDLVEEYPDSSEDELYGLMVDINDEYLYQERANLSTYTDGEIIVFANLGLWYGKQSGYKIITSKKLSDCLYDNDCDYCNWYCDDEDFKFIGHHHDGTNYYTYREINPSLTEEQQDEMFDKLITGLSDEDYEKYTRSLRPYIANIYGFN